MTDPMTSLFTDAKGRPIPTPQLGAPIADTHAHLDMLEDPVGALARAAVVGVGFIATVADVTEDAARTFSDLDGWLAGARTLLDEWGFSGLAVPEVVIVVGAHPHNAQRYLSDPSYRDTLRSYLGDPRVAAIGEVGLDFHYDHSPRDDQRAAYREHLALAHEFDLPVVIHLLTGQTISGKVSFALPQTHSRLSDFLNSRETFFRLEVQGKNYLVQNRFVKLITAEKPG